MTVRQLENSLSSSELTEWMAYYSIQPFGDQREDLRAAIISSTVANCHRGKDTKAFTPENFMPFPQQTQRDLDEATQVKKMLFNLGAKIIEKKRNG